MFLAVSFSLSIWSFFNVCPLFPSCLLRLYKNECQCCSLMCFCVVIIFLVHFKGESLFWYCGFYFYVVGAYQNLHKGVFTTIEDLVVISVSTCIHYFIGGETMVCLLCFTISIPFPIVPRFLIYKSQVCNMKIDIQNVSEFLKIYIKSLKRSTISAYIAYFISIELEMQNLAILKAYVLTPGKIVYIKLS